MVWRCGDRVRSNVQHTTGLLDPLAAIPIVQRQCVLNGRAFLGISVLDGERVRLGGLSRLASAAVHCRYLKVVADAHQIANYGNILGGEDRIAPFHGWAHANQKRQP